MNRQILIFTLVMLFAVKENNAGTPPLFYSEKEIEEGHEIVKENNANTTLSYSDWPEQALSLWKILKI